MPSNRAETLAVSRRGRRVTVCLPTLNEAATVGDIVATIRRQLVGVGLVDEVLVVDDSSTDASVEIAKAAGARVVTSVGIGKGDAMWTGLAESEGDLVVFCDADVRRFDAGFVVGLLEPLLSDGGEPGVSLVKGFYARDLDGKAHEGGRVTELLAKPLLRSLFPTLAGIRQPLGGECAGPRHILEQLPFVAGYGVDIGLLLDAASRFGASSVVQVDLGERTHRNRPLAELAPQADVVLATILARAGIGPPVDQRPALALGAAVTRSETP